MAFFDFLAPIGAGLGALFAAPTGGMSIGTGALLGASVGGSVSSAYSARETNRQQQDLSLQQMEFQKMMSDTAHQREVKDLRAAGLNPILSSRYGGSSTPSGSMAVLQNPDKDVTANITNTARMSLETEMNKELIKTERTKQQVNTALAAKEGSEALNSLEKAKQSRMVTEVMEKGQGVKKFLRPAKEVIDVINPFSYILKNVN